MGGGALCVLLGLELRPLQADEQAVVTAHQAADIRRASGQRGLDSWRALGIIGSVVAVGLLLSSSR